MKKVLLIILLIVIVAGISGGGVYLWQTNKANINKQILQNQTDNLNKQIEINGTSSNQESKQVSLETDNVANWKTYENKEIGISFKYPSEYGDFNLTIRNGGYSGKIYTGEFPNNKFFFVGGVTNDFSAGRGGYFTDFVSYSYEGDKYYYYGPGPATAKELLEPDKILYIDGQQALYVTNNSFVDERGLEGPSLSNTVTNGGVLINLPNNNIFKGIAILNLDKSVLSQDKFLEIVSTLKFTK